LQPSFRSAGQSLDDVAHDAWADLPVTWDRNSVLLTAGALPDSVTAAVPEFAAAGLAKSALDINSLHRRRHYSRLALPRYLAGVKIEI
jgi:hypothetical protein